MQPSVKTVPMSYRTVCQLLIRSLSQRPTIDCSPLEHCVKFDFIKTERRWVCKLSCQRRCSLVKILCMVLATTLNCIESGGFPLQYKFFCSLTIYASSTDICPFSFSISLALCQTCFVYIVKTA